MSENQETSIAELIEDSYNWWPNIPNSVQFKIRRPAYENQNYRINFKSMKNGDELLNNIMCYCAFEASAFCVRNGIDQRYVSITANFKSLIPMQSNVSDLLKNYGFFDRDIICANYYSKYKDFLVEIEINPLTKLFRLTQFSNAPLGLIQIHFYSNTLHFILESFSMPFINYFKSIIYDNDEPYLKSFPLLVNFPTNNSYHPMMAMLPVIRELFSENNAYDYDKSIIEIELPIG